MKIGWVMRTNNVLLNRLYQIVQVCEKSKRRRNSQCELKVSWKVQRIIGDEHFVSINVETFDPWYLFFEQFVVSCEEFDRCLFSFECRSHANPRFDIVDIHGEDERREGER